MTAKKMTKPAMIAHLVALTSHLTQHTAQFPGLVPVIKALSKAAVDPTAAKPVKPVTIDYSEETLLVKGIPWGQLGLALKNTFNQMVGVKTQTVNPKTGEPYFKSCFDKKAKGFRLPTAKKDEVLQALKDAGLPVASS